jgi:hypothetical protein
METSHFIHQDIDRLELSDDFKFKCKKMGYKNLNDIFCDPPKELFEKKGFSYNWFIELSTFLKKEGLLHMLQPIPGR